MRAVKTRGAATAACRGGHVRVNGQPAKPASPVRMGDRVEATLAGQRRVLEVVRIIDKRVRAPLATECVIDHDPSTHERPGAHVAVQHPDDGHGASLRWNDLGRVTLKKPSVDSETPRPECLTPVHASAGSR